MKTKEELNALKEEAEALNSKLAELSEDELAKVSGGRIVRDPEEISGAGSGSSGHLVLDDSDPHDPEELHFPSSDNGLEDTGDVNRRLGI